MIKKGHAGNIAIVTAYVARNTVKKVLIVVSRNFCPEYYYFL